MTDPGGGNHGRNLGPPPLRPRSSPLTHLRTDEDRSQSSRDVPRSGRSNKKTGLAQRHVPNRARSEPSNTQKLSVATTSQVPLLPAHSGTFLFRPSLSEDRPLLPAYTPVGKQMRKAAPQRTANSLEARTVPQRQLPEPRGLDLSNPSVLQIKIRIVGACGVGKSTFLRFATDGNNILSSESTTFAVNEYLCKVKFYEVALEDLQGSKVGNLDWGAEDPARSSDAWGTVILYDVMAPDSLQDVPGVLGTLKTLNEPVVLVAAKCDNPPASRRLQPDNIAQKARSIIQDIGTFESALYATESPGLAIRSLLANIISRHKGSGSPDHRAIVTPPVSPAKVRGPNTSLGTTSPRGLTYRTGGDLTKTSRQPMTTQSASLGQELKRTPIDVPSSDEKRFSHSFLILGESPPSGNNINLLRDPLAVGQVKPARVEKALTFEELVARLLRPVPNEEDEDFVLTFLAFYRAFASPSKLLGTITSHFGSVKQNAVLPWEHKTTRDRDLSIIDLWINQHPGDFAKPSTRKNLLEFLDRISPDSSLKESQLVIGDSEYLNWASHREVLSSVATAQQIRLALQNIVEDEDTEWACSDRGPSSRSRANTFLSVSSIDSLDPKGPPTTSSRNPLQSAKIHAAHDNRIIFGGQATVTLTAIGRDPLGTNFSTATSSSSTLLNVAESANRQASVLVPQPRVVLDKDSWRAILDQPDELIARELTRIDWILFTAIRPRDLIRNITKLPTSTDLSRTSAVDNHENVTRMIDHFNHLAYWTTNLILFREKPKHRAQMLEKLMRVAKCLRNLNNYNGLSAFIAAILSPPISRLSATKDLVDADVQKKFASLVILMSTSRSHWAYRFALDTTEKSGTPRIPFLPLHRRDLLVMESQGKTFVKSDEPADVPSPEKKDLQRPPEPEPAPSPPSTPLTSSRKSSFTLGSTLTSFTTPPSSLSPHSQTPAPPPDRRINWPKFATLGSTLRILQRAQACPYTGFAANEDVRRALLDIKLCKDDDHLYERSCALEAGGAVGGEGAAREGVGVKMNRKIQGGLERLKSR